MLQQKAEMQSSVGWPLSRMLYQPLYVDLVPLWTQHTSVHLHLQRAISGAFQRIKSGLCQYAQQLPTPDTVSFMHLVEDAPVCAVSALQLRAPASCPVTALPEARP